LRIVNNDGGAGSLRQRALVIARKADKLDILMLQ